MHGRRIQFEKETTEAWQQATFVNSNAATAWCFLNKRSSKNAAIQFQIVYVVRDIQTIFSEGYPFLGEGNFLLHKTEGGGEINFLL